MYLVVTVTYQNHFHAKIMRTLNLGNASYHSIQNLVPYFVVSKIVNIVI